MTPNNRIYVRRPILINTHHIPGRISLPTWYNYSQIKFPKRPGPQKQPVESVGKDDVMMPFGCQLSLSRNVRILYICLDHTPPVTGDQSNQSSVLGAYRLNSRFVVDICLPSISTREHQYLRYIVLTSFILCEWGNITTAGAFPSHFISVSPTTVPAFHS